MWGWLSAETARASCSKRRRRSAVKVEAPSGFEPEMEVLQTSALPLGYGAPRVPREPWRAGADKKGAATTAREEGEKLERETGFEPATSTLARSHSTTELFPPSEQPKYHSDDE